MMIQCQTVKIFILNRLCINDEHVFMCLISMLETFHEDVITHNMRTRGSPIWIQQPNHRACSYLSQVEQKQELAAT